MDEPLSNLDAKLRVQMRIEISKIHQRLGATIIYVTHDQTEAMTCLLYTSISQCGRLVHPGGIVQIQIVLHGNYTELCHTCLLYTSFDNRRQHGCGHGDSG